MMTMMTMTTARIVVAGAEMPEKPDNAAIVAELARVKALFQLRTIAAVIGAPPPKIAPGPQPPYEPYARA